MDDRNLTGNIAHEDELDFYTRYNKNTRTWTVYRKDEPVGYFIWKTWRSPGIFSCKGEMYDVQSKRFGYLIRLVRDEKMVARARFTFSYAKVSIVWDSGELTCREESFRLRKYLDRILLSENRRIGFVKDLGGWRRGITYCVDVLY